MADILQITTPALPRNYVNPNVTQAPQDQFQLANTDQVTSAQQRTDQQTQDNADYAGENLLRPLELAISQNPSMTAQSIQSLMTEELMNALKASGNTVGLDELTALANEILLTPENLPADMMEQAKNSTVFNGKLFDMLRNLTNLSEKAFGGSEIRDNVTSFLKSYINATTPEDVMKSLSTTFSFMSNEMFASRSISEELSSLAQKFADNNALENFPELKEQALETMKNASGSLLMTDRLKGIISLVSYNLSRIQNTPDGMKNAFDKLIDSMLQSPDIPKDMAPELQKAFEEFVETAKLPDDVKSFTLGRELVDMGSLSANKLADSVKNFANHMDNPVFLDSLSDIETTNGLFSIKEILSLITPEKNLSDIDNMLESFAQNKDLNVLAEN